MKQQHRTDKVWAETHRPEDTEDNVREQDIEDQEGRRDKLRQETVHNGLNVDRTKDRRDRESQREI